MAEYQISFGLGEKGKRIIEGSLKDFLDNPLVWVAQELQKDDTDLTKAKLLAQVISLINDNKKILMPKEYTVNDSGKGKSG